jgi:hypothetical protein
MEIIIKNRLVSPLPQEPACGHESCLPASDNSLNPELVDVITSAIKSIKKIVIKLYGTKRGHTWVTKHMDRSLTASLTSSAYREYAHFQLNCFYMKLVKDALLNYQPDENLNMVKSFFSSIKTSYSLRGVVSPCCKT